MIFVNLIYRHFDILMSQYGQVTKSCAFQGCAKVVLQLHTARMENPDTPRTHSSISDFHEYHLNTHRHPPDIPQTPQDISKEIKMSTDDNKRQQTPPDTLRHWQVLFEYVWRCLLARVVVCWHLEFLGDVWGVSGGYLGVYESYS